MKKKATLPSGYNHAELESRYNKPRYEAVLARLEQLEINPFTSERFRDTDLTEEARILAAFLEVPGNRE